MESLQTQLESLPTRAVVLRYLHGYSNVEIADLLDVDVRTVTRLLTRAM